MSGDRTDVSGDRTDVSGALAESAALLQRLYLAWGLKIEVELGHLAG